MCLFEKEMNNEYLKIHTHTYIYIYIYNREKKDNNRKRETESKREYMSRTPLTVFNIKFSKRNGKDSLVNKVNKQLRFSLIVNLLF